MEIEIISHETIKPSAQTPFHLKNHKLSLLDQFAPNIYIPVILFYPMNQAADPAKTNAISKTRSKLLKQSLSQTLTHFYPFAGIMKDNLSIDCNDEGAYYIEARTGCSLSEYLNQPDYLALLRKFIPHEASFVESNPGSHLCMIQETNFTCGGLAIGIFISHTTGDGNSMSLFLRSWAATAHKTDKQNVLPDFDASSVFHHSNASPLEVNMGSLSKPFLKMGKIVTRRFVFDATAIASLKDQATSSRVANPTRVEVVSALLCKTMMAAFKARWCTNRPTYITYSVNISGRTVPPLPGCSIGNFALLATALFSPDQENDLASMVCQLREAFKQFDGDFVKNLQGDEGFFKLQRLIKEKVDAISSAMATSGGGLNHISFTSWCNFGLYDADFGWGKPVWVSSIGLEGKGMFNNMILLMDARKEKGVEAWVLLDEQEMATLESDEELLAHASIDSSPLDLGMHA